MNQRFLAAFVLVIFLETLAVSQNAAQGTVDAPVPSGAVKTPVTQAPIAPDEGLHGNAGGDPDTTSVFHIQHAQASTVARIIERLLSKQRITLAVDEKTNSIIVHSTKASLQDVEEMIKVIDVPLKTAVLRDEPDRVSSETIPAKNSSNGEADISVAELRRQATAQERKVQLLAAKHKGSSMRPSEAEASRKKLREAVRQAYESRQELQRAELTKFQKRLEALKQSLERHDRIADKIIDCRVEELIEPKLKFTKLPDSAGSPSENPEPSTAATVSESGLDGTWEVERTSHDGKESGVAAEYVFYRWRFDAKARTVSTEWKRKSGESHSGENRFTLDQTTTPKHLTMYGDRSLVQGIYELKGDRLHVAVFGRSEVERPEAFDSKSRNNAGPLVVFEFKRAKVENAQSSLVQSVSDVDAGPVWGEAVDGLQLAVSGIRQDRHFKSGDTIRFRLSVRNVGKETIRFEYRPPKMCDWIAPHVEKANGERVKFRQMSFRGGHKHFTETLEPNAVASIHLSGILVLGESDTGQKNWPSIEIPEPGAYKLRGGYSVVRLDADGKPTIERNADGMRTVKSSDMTSGPVKFHIDEQAALHVEGD